LPERPTPEALTGVETTGGVTTGGVVVVVVVEEDVGFAGVVVVEEDVGFAGVVVVVGLVVATVSCGLAVVAAPTFTTHVPEMLPA
jgi:hypothetical protein